VIHGDDESNSPRRARTKWYRASGAGAANAQRARLLDGGSDDGGILRAEDSMLAGVGIEAADRERGALRRIHRSAS